jgi:hypothetical protein
MVAAEWVWKALDEEGARVRRLSESAGIYIITYQIFFSNMAAAESALAQIETRQANGADFAEMVSFAEAINNDAQLVMGDPSTLVSVTDSEDASDGLFFGLFSFPVIVGIAGGTTLVAFGGILLAYRRKSKQRASGPTSQDTGNLPRTRSTSRFESDNPHFRGPLPGGIKGDDYSDSDDDDSNLAVLGETARRNPGSLTSIGSSYNMDVGSLGGGARHGRSAGSPSSGGLEMVEKPDIMFDSGPAEDMNAYALTVDGEAII